MPIAAPARWSMAAAVCLLAAGCGTEPPDGIVGTYHATEIALTIGGVDSDMLAEGGVLTITLTETGTTTGTFVVPAQYTESGQQETSSLAGTYLYDADAGTATFEHEADTFIRDVVWTADQNELRGDFGSGDDRVSVTLERQD